MKTFAKLGSLAIAAALLALAMAGPAEAWGNKSGGGSGGGYDFNRSDSRGSTGRDHWRPANH